MSRCFVKINEDAFRKKIEKYMGGDSYSWIENMPEKILKDIKINFDWENFEWEPESWTPSSLMGVKTIDGFTFWGMCAGGDWEQPVFFILYWDGKNIRAYVPTKGNPWNQKTKEAYGNDYNKSFEEELLDDNRTDLINGSFNEKLILEDIKNRIVEKI